MESNGGTNFKEILGTLQNFNRPAWRPATTCLALIGLMLFGAGLILFDALWARISACVGGVLTQLWVNGMEIANPLTSALTKKARKNVTPVAPAIPAGMKLVRDEEPGS